jgi:hypothetical protein
MTVWYWLFKNKSDVYEQYPIEKIDDTAVKTTVNPKNWIDASNQ